MHKTNIIFAAMMVVLAQTAFAASGDLTLRVSPHFPGPRQQFTIQATSLVMDAIRANIQWYQNGTLAFSGIGKTSASFVAGETGTSQTIKVVAISQEGQTYAAETQVSVGDIDFIIYPDTSTPALYRGAALPTPGSNVAIYAIPHLFSRGDRLNPQSLVYEWVLDDTNMGEQSGGGKNRFVFSLNKLRGVQYKISLRASSQSGDVATQKNLTVRTFEPQILFYERSPLTGDNAKAKTVFEISKGGALSIIARPFFFAVSSLKSATFDWTANGERLAQTGSNPLILDLRAPADAALQSSFSLKIRDSRSIFQQAQNSFTVKSEQ